MLVFEEFVVGLPQLFMDRGEFLICGIQIAVLLLQFLFCMLAVGNVIEEDGNFPALVPPPNRTAREAYHRQRAGPRSRNETGRQSERSFLYPEPVGLVFRKGYPHPPVGVRNFPAQKVTSFSLRRLYDRSGTGATPARYFPGREKAEKSSPVADPRAIGSSPISY